jgi:hypothetical protein
MLAKESNEAGGNFSPSLLAKESNDAGGLPGHRQNTKAGSDLYL